MNWIELHTDTSASEQLSFLDGPQIVSPVRQQWMYRGGLYGPELPSCPICLWSKRQRTGASICSMA